MKTIDTHTLIERVKTGRHVVVLRGISGAGKSTLARRLFDSVGGGEDTFHAAIVSADQYFTDDGGTYRFDPSLLGEAHGSCLRAFVTLLDSLGDEHDNALIIVDNTNTSLVEAAPYMALAAAYGAEALLVTLDVPIFDAYQRNVHGVSANSIDAQFWRLHADAKSIPPFWDAVTLVEERAGIEYVHEVPVTLGESLDPSELANGAANRRGPAPKGVA